MLPHLTSVFFGTSANGLAAVGAVLLLGLFLIGFLAYAFFGYCSLKIFEKAGRPGYIGFIPIYNTWTLYEIAGKPGWLSLIILPFLIPFPPLEVIAGLALLGITLIVDIELSKRFGKGTGFTVVLFLFPWIGLPMLAFGDAKYNGPTQSTAPGATPPQPGPTPFAAAGPAATVSPDPGVIAPGAPAPIPPQPPTPPTPPAPTPPAAPEIQPPSVPPTPPTPPLPPSPIQ